MQEAYRPPHSRSKCLLCWGGTPSQVGGGTPSQVQRGTLSQVWGGTPSQVWGVPHPMGYLPGQTWDGVPPCPDMGWGTPPHLDLGWGTPPHLDLRWGTPRKCGLTNKLKTVPSPILRIANYFFGVTKEREVEINFSLKPHIHVPSAMATAQFSLFWCRQPLTSQMGITW